MPKLATRHKPHVTGHHPTAFTLIELLVVIAIIAILMGLAFPAYQTVLVRTYKTSAQNNVTSLEEAVRAYMLEYGRLPVTDTTENGKDSYYDKKSELVKANEIVSVLLGNNVNGLNPKGKVFLEAKAAKKKGGKLVDGVDMSTYTFYDPWGTPYAFKLDTSYDNKLEYYSTSWDKPNYFRPVIVVSYGPNGEQDDPAKSGYDDMMNK